ncbi:MAG: type II toxin-antitoxin system Phd/YefM family antitoxin [bacterium]
MTEAQTQLPRLLRQAESGGTVGIRRRNDTVAYLVSRQRMEAIVETMELLANPAAMRAIATYRAGKAKFVALSTLDDE